MAEIPRFPGIRFAGDPLEDGSLLMASADTRPRDYFRAMALLTLQKNGHEITRDVFHEVEQFALKREHEFLEPFRARGVPKTFQDLFAARRKKDLERVAKEVVVQKSDLPDLHYNCHRLGLSHHSKHFQWAPEQRALTDAERETLFAMGDAPTTPEEERVASKVRQFFVEREHRSVHMFAGAGEAWHCVFLSFEDIADQKGNHWRGGPHVHFINHTFDPKRLTKKKVWKGLQEQRYAIPTPLHLRYDYGVVTSDAHPLLYVDGETGRSKKIPPR